MASFEPILRMDENAFRAPEKLQPKTGRKPLTDMTNSKKPFAKNKASAENFNAFKPVEKVVQPKAGRKPLGDLTNSKQPRAQVSSKKNCTGRISAANKGQSDSFIYEEGFLHNHDECIKANQQASALDMEYFLESVGLKKDSSLKLTPLHPRLSDPLDPLELDTTNLLEELELDMSFSCASPAPSTPPSLKCPSSPDWDIEDMELPPLKLRDSPIRD